ncbi:hypothetical protein BC629DRAFT_1480632 [Irpex lacteus]|nr:hypothetical protein BC629DRAFT_1480632 [Irpex lacteus]
MAITCATCSPNRTFSTRSAYTAHCRRVHSHRTVTQPRSTFRYHPCLNGRPCARDGQFLPRNAPVPPRDNTHDWTPFASRPAFELAELIFEREEMSKGRADDLLKIWTAHQIEMGHFTDAPYHDYNDLTDTIDAIELGDAPWEAFTVRYGGPLNNTSPAWKREAYTIYARNTLTVMRSILANSDYDRSFEYSPYREYIGPEIRRWSNLMSGDWAWDKATEIAKNPAMQGAMLCPVISGADKTTVSVATGQTEYHPVYASCGNLKNAMRRAHREGVVPVAFLAIPKGTREYDDDDEFRLFRKQLYHTSLAQVFAPLKPGMTTPEIMQCPDGHYRKVVFELGPFIADYPEQVMLAGIVQGWCPKCLSPSADLQESDEPRFRELTETLLQYFDDDRLWETFGIDAGVIPYTAHFPRADIHELLSPDILHQLVKGTFKDHLVTWVEVYITSTRSAREAKKVLDDIDRRIASVSPFPGLRRFPEGRRFKQWTGNDSKALMKVFLPAIVGYVPDRMVSAIRAFLDFCYLARQPFHTRKVLNDMNNALAEFRTLRTIFQEVGVRPDGFALPRQHSLVHYVRSIELFGSPNGLCSSITESRHITAVKRPWRRSNRHNPLLQMLRTNSRLSKLAAARIEFGRRGMLHGDVLTAAKVNAVDDANLEDGPIDEDDAGGYEGPHAEYFFEIARRAAETSDVDTIAAKLNEPRLQELCRRFLYDQLHPDAPMTGEEVSLHECPYFYGRVSRFYSGRAIIYAPSEDSGTTGLHTETIRSHPHWRRGRARYDTVLVQNGPEADTLSGMLVGRVLSFLSFAHEDVRYDTALLEWFLPLGEEPDPVTGMWIVRPEMRRGQRHVGLVHIDSIVRGCHLIGVYGKHQLPRDFHFSFSLDAFQAFYLNHYIDYHAHQYIR